MLLLCCKSTQNLNNTQFPCYCKIKFELLIIILLSIFTLYIHFGGKIAAQKVIKMLVSAKKDNNDFLEVNIVKKIILRWHPFKILIWRKSLQLLNKKGVGEV